MIIVAGQILVESEQRKAYLQSCVEVIAQARNAPGYLGCLCRIAAHAVSLDAGRDLRVATQLHHGSPSDAVCAERESVRRGGTWCPLRAWARRLLLPWSWRVSGTERLW